MKFFIGISRYRLNLKECMSLKDKRKIMKSLVDRLGNVKQACAIEVGAGDQWKSGVIAFACISSSRQIVERSLYGSRELLDASGVEVVEEEQWLVKPEDIMGPL